MVERERIMEERIVDESERRVSMFKVKQLIWLIFGVIEGLIALRVMLKLIAANPSAPFAAFTYDLTEPFLLPFIGLTGTPSAGGIVLEISSIIAIIVYALLAWLIIKVINVVFYRPRLSRPATYEETTISEE
ncbi:MAG TPA: YggT family protein [Anaerolineae bacterium]|nr:YggT family protein [Anaerolineae bacterium]